MVEESNRGDELIVPVKRNA